MEFLGFHSREVNNQANGIYTEQIKSVEQPLSFETTGSTQIPVSIYT